jgi:hypothetical protein
MNIICTDDMTILNQQLHEAEVTRGVHDVPTATGKRARVQHEIDTYAVSPIIGMCVFV